MSEHKATIRWTRTGDEFLKGKFPRAHTWSFDGGLSVPASSSPAAVPVPYSNPANIDPEEAYVASISKLSHDDLSLGRIPQRVHVDSYEDEAVGVLTKNEKGIPWVSVVTLHPKISYSGDKVPTAEDIEKFHHLAHDNCFISNSVKTEIKVAG
jgi:Predicted redox protein, regulator of disulfide bond formation